MEKCKHLIIDWVQTETDFICRSCKKIIRFLKENNLEGLNLVHPPEHDFTLGKNETLEGRNKNGI